jgi:2,3,4,5-tetrahydropyridine-2,6-dicarboxylate N-succinyltransferase
MSENNQQQDKQLIESAWQEKKETLDQDTREAIVRIIESMGRGELRVAESVQPGRWQVQAWLKEAILLYFKHTESVPSQAGDFHFFDKVPLKVHTSADGVRVVPPATVRWGAYVAPGVVLMPSYINIGAWVGEGTMIDTWATVGSCAQVGRHCHVSGGVGIGGVLEPVQAAPVIIEDNVFLGARCEVAEGVIVEEGAVLAMGCYAGASTKIYNAMTGEITSGRIPKRAVVVPGSLPSRDGSHNTYALIIKKIRDEKTDARTALNELLR